MLTKYAEVSAPERTVEVLDGFVVPENAGTKRLARLRRRAHRHHFEYSPRRGYIYVRSRAISSRCNDNFDEFPADEIRKAYATFVGKPVFVNHHNSDHRRARGVIIDAALHEDTNPDGTEDVWAEVLMEVDAVRFPVLAREVIAGNIARTSMGTDVEYSECTACGNRAVTPADYCQHIPKMKGMKIRRPAYTADGRVAGTEEVLIAERCYGLRFFENSLLVEDPADPTAFVLGVDDGSGITASAAKAVIEEAEGVVRQAAAPVGRTAARQPAFGDTLRAQDLTPGEKVFYRHDEVGIRALFDAEVVKVDGEDITLRPINGGSRGTVTVTDAELADGDWTIRRAAAAVAALEAEEAQMQTPASAKTYEVISTIAGTERVEFRGTEPDEAINHALAVWHGERPDACRVQATASRTSLWSKTAGPGDYEEGRLDALDDGHAGTVKTLDGATDDYANGYRDGLLEFDIHTLRRMKFDAPEKRPNWFERILGLASKQHTAYGEVKAPAKVDTLRAEACPVCGDNEGFNGDKCSVCGYAQPPSQFQDPDLSKARENDLRQEQGDPQAVDGAVDEAAEGDLECDQCGEVFSAEGNAPTDAEAEAGADGEEDAEAADAEADPAGQQADPTDLDDLADVDDDDLFGDDEDEEVDTDGDGASEADGDEDEDPFDIPDEDEEEDPISSATDPAVGEARITAEPEDSTETTLDAPVTAGATCPVCGEGILNPRATTVATDGEPPLNEVGTSPTKQTSARRRG